MNRINCCWVGALLSAISAALAPAAVDIIPTHGRNVFRLAIARTGAAQLIIGATWDNRLCAYTVAGQHRWDSALGGFAFDLGCADLDGDGFDEILTAGADGTVACFSADGKVRWKHHSPAPLQQVTVARLDGKSPVVLAGGMTREILVFAPSGELLRSIRTEGALGNVAIRMLRAGDFDGDGQDEVALVGLRGRAMDLRFLKGTDLKPLPGEWSLDALKTANGTVADVDGDGAADLLVGPVVISLKSQINPATPSPQSKSVTRKGQSKKTAAGQRDPAAPPSGRQVHLPAEPKTVSYDIHYRMRSLAAGDLTGKPGRELVILDGPDLQLCAADGTVLGATHASLSFTDVVFLPGTPNNSVVLGSGLGGDDNLYRVTFKGDWANALASLSPPGERNAITRNVNLVARQAAHWQGQPMVGAAGPIDVVVTHHMWAGAANLKSVDAWIEEVRFFERTFPYPRLRFSTCIWPGEKLPLLRPDGKEWPHDRRLAHNLTREQLLEVARRFEQAGCRFWIQVGHGCAPHLGAASALAMLEAAPTMCLGFVSAEDEQADQMAYYFEHQVQPLLEACLARGKHFMPRNKNVWWAHWPADPTLRKLIFNGRYRSVLLPCVEDSNTRTADVQLAARVGLWLDGQVDNWASRISADWFSFNRAWEWEAVKTGHPHLRYLVSQAFLGARVFMLLPGDRQRNGGDWTRVGTEGVAPFLHLIGRGAIVPPAREQMQGITPLVLNLPQASERFARHGANGHGFQQWDVDDTDRKAWAFDRLDCFWGMAPLPSTDVATWLWGRNRRSADQIPVTGPHGFVCIVPGPAPQSSTRWPTVWTTDGDRLSKAGKPFALPAARTAMTADLAIAAKQLPLQVDGPVFWQVTAQPDHRYVLCVMDPGWMDPQPRRATVRTNLPGDWQATDRLSGERLGVIAAELELQIPAGAFRLIELSAN